MILRTINQIKTELLKNPMKKSIIFSKLKEIETELYSVRDARNNGLPPEEIAEVIDSIL